jgi:colanic acid biosynthesis glycosyl transferase WcaI
MLESVPDIQFLMVGNGAGRQSAENYVSNLGLSNVRFLPYQPQSDIPAMYGAADVCLVPLRKGFAAESVPSKLFSIMAAARPAIASVDESSETATLLSRSGGGLTVPPESSRALADAILYYYRNSEQRISSGLKGRSCVERDFVPGAIADRYLELLHKAVENT